MGVVHLARQKFTLRYQFRMYGVRAEFAEGSGEGDAGFSTCCLGGACAPSRRAQVLRAAGAVEEADDGKPEQVRDRITLMATTSPEH
jgi:hypothetical protein